MILVRWQSRDREARHLSRLRLVTWLLPVVGIFLLFLFFMKYQNPEHPAPKPEGMKAEVPTTLVDQWGRVHTIQSLPSKPSIVSFGVTNCLDICPTTLYHISQIIDSLGSDKQRYNFIFISLDPAYDTPERLRTYLEPFNSDIIALTGSISDIEKIKSDLFAYYDKTYGGILDAQNSDSDRPAIIYLVDKVFAVFGTLDTSLPPESNAAILRALF